jgi:hypothetical protein
MLGNFSRPATSLSSSSSSIVPPVGLAGLLMMMRRVFSLKLAITSSALKEKPLSSCNSIGTALAPVYLIIDS